MPAANISSKGDSGHPLTVWNRTPPAESCGAQVANSAAEAVKGKAVVFTSLSGDAATIAVTSEILHAMEAGAIHVCLSTISVSQRLAEAHQQQG